MPSIRRAKDPSNGGTKPFQSKVSFQRHEVTVKTILFAYDGSIFVDLPDGPTRIAGSTYPILLIVDKSFEVLDNSLPRGDAYDVVYRHGLDIDPTGDMLGMGSTTVSLWISEDQGDWWTTVSSFLPPIYCARFA